MRILSMDWMRTLITALLSLCMCLSAHAQPDDSDTRPAGLRTVSLYSQHVARELKYDIVLPPGYEQSRQQYPVIYLLHGFMQNYTVWGRNLGAAQVARELGDVIVVMPDAGNSWYVDYAESHEGQVNQWESYLMEDLIPHVDQHFRTIAEREGRAIAGLSMGGYGAFMLGLRHPDQFLSVASSSGALSYARDRAEELESGESPRIAQAPHLPARMRDAERTVAELIDVPGFSTQEERTPAGIAFLTAEQALAHDPFSLIYDVPRDQLPHFHVDAGTEDSLLREAHEMAQLLILNGVPVSYMQGEGGHDAGWWRRSVRHFLPVQRDQMRQALQQDGGAGDGG